ncbi:hypothetical protein NBRC111894_1874 [Sporolactobacillus inulinus]|uniref:Uncharacterized protein n=1 Tax=Sporolactobacillus inulinus TaxID=2078 RepID=A0A4Y1ZBC3_9BACL|nr:hypothetical protein NBRC111894_1874 [Sporolactobacillus inulinus]
MKSFSNLTNARCASFDQLRSSHIHEAQFTMELFSGKKDVRTGNG